ncbi:Nn.00g115530.m01.CDS01 [Neocucurbitaria sp. VM-36]
MWRFLGFSTNNSETPGDIAPERSIPASWYRSSSIFELERRAIFSRKWLLLTHKLRFHKSGEYISFDYAGFPLFLILDQQGNINGFHNVCRHRAYPIVQESNVSWVVVWLEGQSSKGTRFDTVPRFDKSQHNLLPVHVHVDKAGFVWVNLQAGTPDTPWASQFGGVDEQPRMTQFGALDGYAYDHTWNMDIDANWKVVMENYNECYHCLTSHPLIAGVSDIPKYRVEPDQTGNCLEHTIVNKSSGTADEDKDEMRRCITFYFPATSVTVTRNFFYIQRMIPRGSDGTLVENEIYRHKNATDANFDDVMSFYRQVLTEDKLLCEGAQKNLNTGVFVNGELHPDKEKGPIHFQTMVKQELMEHRRKEVANGGQEMWPATPILSGQIDTKRLHEEEKFCSELEASMCSSQRAELVW